MSLMSAIQTCVCAHSLDVFKILLEGLCHLKVVILLQDFVRTKVTVETMMSNPTDVGDGGEIPPASHLLR